MDYKAIGMRIKRRRKALHLTQLELSEKVGLTESSISRYESGKIATMPTSTVNRICNVLKIKPSELLGLNHTNSFEYDLKDILMQVEDLPIEIKREILNSFKSQIEVYRRLYHEQTKDNNNVLEEIKE